MLRLPLLAGLCLLAVAATEAEVRTVAGSGTDSRTVALDALAAELGQTYGVEIGPDGALYVCDITKHQVRRVDLQARTISIVAGTGEKGYSGDGGPATKAQLNEPYEVRFDGAGNMYFVEMRNAVVRRVDAQTGVVSTIAGTGKHGFGGDGGPAREAQFSRPHSIALDHSGNLYVCDIGNHRIRRIDLETGRIDTYAGTGEREPTPDGAPLTGTPLNGPRALDFDGRHTMYLALREGNAVYRIDLQTDTLHHVAGTGQKGFSATPVAAKQAELSGPKGITIAPNGDVYLADTESHTVRVIRVSGVVETVVGDGTRGNGPDGAGPTCRLARPHGVCVDGRGNVFIGDSENNVVRVLRAGSD